VADDGELVRRWLALERRFLRPDRVALDESILAGESGPEIWRRAIAAGRLPASWADDPLRRFRATEAQRRRVPEVAVQKVPAYGRAQWLSAVPIDRQAARLLASDPRGMLEAEQHARELVAALRPFGLEAAPGGIAWRIAGCAVERPEAGEALLGRLRAPIQRARELMQRLTGRLLDPPHPHVRFRLTHELLVWSHRRARGLDLRIPDEFGPLAGRRLGEIADPFGPWLELIATGYWPWAPTDSTIELAAGFAVPSGPRPDKRGRPGIARVSSPSTLWAERLSELRLSCMRGDATWVERGLARVSATQDPGSAPLIHFAVYGGPTVLDVLAARDPALDVEAVDDEGRTPLMLAAALPRGGPLGSDPRERDSPRSLALAEASIPWLLARGASLEARDLRGWTAMHWAAFEGRRIGVETLARRRAPTDVRDAIGRTPLLVALSDDGKDRPLSDLRETIQALLAAGADADARDDLGWNALHYLAVSHHAPRRRLALDLRRAGAQPSRDRLDRTPADIGSLVGPDRDPAFDPRTPVAAGPGPWPPRVRAAELERALTEDPDVAGRGPLDTLAVWADWLQSHGDPRGELLAAELSTRAIGRKRRPSRLCELERLQLRLGPIVDRGLRLADPDRPIGGSRIEVRRAHQLVVRARFDLQSLSARSLTALLEHEPLLVDLRLDCTPSDEWRRWLPALHELPTAPQVRRLTLGSLPSEVPRIDVLARVFPRARELRLIGRGKLDTLAIDWPGLEILRVRHGDTSEWGRGGSAFDLAIPSLRTLDLRLPIGARTQDEEVAGFRRVLEQLDPELGELRLSPVAAEFLAVLLEVPLPAGLTSLALDRVRGRAIEQLVDHLGSSTTTRFDRLERFELRVTGPVFDQRRVELTMLRERLPALVFGIS
jgi:hypothetical protein